MKKLKTRKQVIFRFYLSTTGIYLVIASIIPLSNWNLKMPTPLWQWILVAAIYIFWMYAMNLLVKATSRETASWHQLQFDFEERKEDQNG